MKVQAIIPTAGSGTRFHPDQHKPLAEIHGKPVIGYTLDVFERCPDIDSVVLVGQEGKIPDLERLVRQEGFKKVAHIIPGGQTRRESVANGLKHVDGDTEIVVIHDGVRPLVTRELIEKVIKACAGAQAAIAGIPVKPTIKKVNRENLVVEETLDRENLWEIQTPQAFRKDILIKAHRGYAGGTVTDDAMMVEQMGVNVNVVRGDGRNIKITMPEDLRVAEAFMNSNDGASI